MSHIPHHLMLLTITIQFFASGSNNFGKLGLGLDPDKNSEVTLYTKMKPFTSKKLHRLHMGINHVLVTDVDGTLYGWGMNEQGELASPYDNYITSPKPIQWFIDNKIKIRYADGGIAHSIAITLDNLSIYSFGSNHNGQLGRHTSQENNPIPGKVNLSALQKDETIVSAHTQGLVNYLLTNKGNLYAWGSCQNHLCPGHNETEILYVATKIELNQTIKYLHVGTHNIWYMDDQGDLYSFGYNKYGQLCRNTGDQMYTNVPGKTNLRNIYSVDGSQYHTVVLIDGQAYGCGRGTYGELGEITQASVNIGPLLLPQSLGEVIDVAVTTGGTLMLTDKGLFATGNDSFGELSLGPVETNTKVFKFVSLPHDITQLNDIVGHTSSSFMYALTGQSHKLTGGQITGIVFGVLAGVIAIVVCVFFLIKYKSKLTCCKCPGKSGKTQYQHVQEDTKKLVFNDGDW